MSDSSARQLWRTGDAAAAIREAWAAHDRNPDGLAEKHLVAEILHEELQLLTGDRVASFLALLRDPKVDPAALTGAGWSHLMNTALDRSLRPAELAARIEGSPLALALLTEDVVVGPDAERLLSAVRRFLLLQSKWPDFPLLSAALIRQAARNQGAWPFDEGERARLDGPFAAAYLPSRPARRHAADYADAVTRAVAEQYEGWPYPAWQRITWRPPKSQAEVLRDLDPDGPVMGEPADVLIAGCGTGRQAALLKMNFPNDRIVAIDISAASLDYAEERCRALGLDDIEFQQRDLHAVEALGRRFDAIHCTGVLHHLPDPEAGWAALNRVLKPGGVMHVMVYSRVARLRVRGLRQLMGDLVERPVDDDLLREARRRALALPKAMHPSGRDFSTLAGVHDLLLHRHEDPFDIPRIRRALERLELRFLGFRLRHQRDRMAYRDAHPDDPHMRSFDRWMMLERRDPMIFAGMYDFWCRKAP